MSLIKTINNRFGTHRGLIRCILSQIKYLSGLYKQQENVQWDKVKRLVFVCQGNICRSPFADALAKKHASNTVSFGYSTTTGVDANQSAIFVAQSKFDIDLSQHKATDMNDFVYQDGDLLIVMEDRHLGKLRIPEQHLNIQVTLLGIWAKPARALIYDPFSLSNEYFESCFIVIKSAVDNIIKISKLQ